VCLKSALFEILISVRWWLVTEALVPFQNRPKNAGHLGVYEYTGGRYQWEGTSQVAESLKRVVALDSKRGFTHSMPCPCRAHAIPPAMPCVKSHMPCRAPALLRQCRVLRESPRGSRKYPNSYSNSLTDCLLCRVLIPHFTVVGMDRCEEDWYACDNNLRGTPRGNRKKPTAGR
jgi:hypothetical protein